MISISKIQESNGKHLYIVDCQVNNGKSTCSLKPRKFVCDHRGFEDSDARTRALQFACGTAELQAFRDFLFSEAEQVLEASKFNRRCFISARQDSKTGASFAVMMSRLDTGRLRSMSFLVEDGVDGDLAARNRAIQFCRSVAYEKWRCGQTLEALPKDQSGRRLRERGLKHECAFVEIEQGEKVDCICGKNRSRGLMMACEQCGSWEHAECQGFKNDRQIPNDYICSACKRAELEEVIVLRMSEQGEACGHLKECKMEESRSKEREFAVDMCCCVCGCEDTEDFETLVSACSCGSGTAVAHASCLSACDLASSLPTGHGNLRIADRQFSPGEPCEMCNSDVRTGLVMSSGAPCVSGKIGGKEIMTSSNINEGSSKRGTRSKESSGKGIKRLRSALNNGSSSKEHKVSPKERRNGHRSTKEEPGESGEDSGDGSKRIPKLILKIAKTGKSELQENFSLVEDKHGANPLLPGKVQAASTTGEVHRIISEAAKLPFIGRRFSDAAATMVPPKKRRVQMMEMMRTLSLPRPSSPPHEEVLCNGESMAGIGSETAALETKNDADTGMSNPVITAKTEDLDCMTSIQDEGRRLNFNRDEMPHLGERALTLLDVAAFAAAELEQSLQHSQHNQQPESTQCITKTASPGLESLVTGHAEGDREKSGFSAVWEGHEQEIAADCKQPLPLPSEYQSAPLGGSLPVVGDDGRDDHLGSLESSYEAGTNVGGVTEYPGIGGMVKPTDGKKGLDQQDGFLASRGAALFDLNSDPAEESADGGIPDNVGCRKLLSRRGTPDATAGLGLTGCLMSTAQANGGDQSELAADPQVFNHLDPNEMIQVQEVKTLNRRQEGSNLGESPVSQRGKGEQDTEMREAHDRTKKIADDMEGQDLGKEGGNESALHVLTEVTANEIEQMEENKAAELASLQDGIRTKVVDVLPDIEPEAFGGNVCSIPLEAGVITSAKVVNDCSEIIKVNDCIVVPDIEMSSASRSPQHPTDAFNSNIETRTESMLEKVGEAIAEVQMQDGTLGSPEQSDQHDEVPHAVIAEPLEDFAEKKEKMFEEGLMETEEEGEVGEMLQVEEDLDTEKVDYDYSEDGGLEVEEGEQLQDVFLEEGTREAESKGLVLEGEDAEPAEMLKQAQKGLEDGTTLSTKSNPQGGEQERASSRSAREVNEEFQQGTATDMMGQGSEVGSLSRDGGKDMSNRGSNVHGERERDRERSRSRQRHTSQGISIDEDRRQDREKRHEAARDEGQNSRHGNDDGGHRRAHSSSSHEQREKRSEKEGNRNREESSAAVDVGAIHRTGFVSGGRDPFSSDATPKVKATGWDLLPPGYSRAEDAIRDAKTGRLAFSVRGNEPLPPSSFSAGTMRAGTHATPRGGVGEGAHFGRGLPALRLEQTRSGTWQHDELAHSGSRIQDAEMSPRLHSPSGRGRGSGRGGHISVMGGASRERRGWHEGPPNGSSWGNPVPPPSRGRFTDAPPGGAMFVPPVAMRGLTNAAALAAAKVESSGFMVAPDGTITKAGGGPPGGGPLHGMPAGFSPGSIGGRGGRGAGGFNIGRGPPLGLGRMNLDLMRGLAMGHISPAMAIGLGLGVGPNLGLNMGRPQSGATMGDHYGGGHFLQDRDPREGARGGLPIAGRLGGRAMNHHEQAPWGHNQSRRSRSPPSPHRRDRGGGSSPFRFGSPSSRTHSRSPHRNSGTAAQGRTRSPTGSRLREDFLGTAGPGHSGVESQPSRGNHPLDAPKLPLPPPPPRGQRSPPGERLREGERGKSREKERAMGTGGRGRVGGPRRLSPHVVHGSALTDERDRLLLAGLGSTGPQPHGKDISTSGGREGKFH